MRMPGITGTIQIAIASVLAIPVAFFGASLLVDGDLVLGAAFLAFAGLMVLLPWRLTSPLEPTNVAESVTDRVTGDDE